MKTAVTKGPRTLQVIDAPEPTLGPGEALLKVERVGICGSDLHVYAGTLPNSRYPLVQGHEFCGTILAVNAAGQSSLRVGELVAVEPLVPCGSCYACRRSRTNVCSELKVIGGQLPGALSEFIVVPIKTMYPVADLDPELAALVEPVSIGVQAVTRGAVEAGEKVVVFGAGPIGQALLIAARDKGAHVLVIDRLPSRLELAKRLRADAVEVNHPHLQESIREWTGGDGAAVAFDTTGAPTVILSAFQVIANSGRIVVIGFSDQDLTLPVLTLTEKEPTILGVRNNSGVFGEAVELVRRNREQFRLLVTHHYDLDQAADAMEFALNHPAECGKVQIQVAN